jgi:acetyltransferase-like isoleucine patch superfamily enzyme
MRKSKFFKRFLRKIIDWMILQYLLIRCRINYSLFGANGVGLILERVPEVFVIPIMKKYGLSIGYNSKIKHGISFNYLGGKQPFKNLIIGDNVYIGRKVFFDLTCTITLNDDCAIGAGSQIWTHVGDYTYDFSDYHEIKKPVVLGKGVLCWSGIIISPGVTIGDYTRVAAGSVVTKDIQGKCFAGGVPAKFIKNREL